jgi:site-specific recombinase XerD
MELLLAGVDITSIAGWLGHESLSSTEIYAQATLEMKEKALKKVEPQKFTKGNFKPDNKLMSFLKGL